MLRLLCALCASFLGFSIAQAHPIQATSGETILYRLPEPVSTLAIGNPNVASLNLHDDQTVLITGLTAGRTNILALNERGQVIYANDLQVSYGRAASVSIYRNTERETYDCAPYCRPDPQPGDNIQWLNNQLDAYEARQSSLMPAPQDQGINALPPLFLSTTAPE